MNNPYDVYVPAEINQPSAGALLLVGRDPGEREVEVKRPFVGPAGYLLDQMLEQVGLKRTDVNIANVVPYRPKGNVFNAHSTKRIKDGQAELKDLIRRLRPKAIVAMGNEAAHTLIEDWPGDTIRKATGIEERRGFVFDGPDGIPVIPTVHPAAILRMWTPWRLLVPRDLAKANGDLTRPVRTVKIVTSSNVDEAMAAVRSANRIACDIEIAGSDWPACIGFAPSRSEAWVFPPPYFLHAFKLLEEGHDFVFANGQFDIHFLHTRCGINVNRLAHDTQLAWHSLYPELAGKSEFSDARTTRKSLSFLSSIFTNDRWWKDYEFQNEDERYYLNGIDCCVTLEVMEKMLPMIDVMQVREIYKLERDLVWPCVKMQARGLRVDENKRQAALDELEDRHKQTVEDIQKLAIPLLEQAHADGKLPKPHLFEEVWTCPCCKNGSGKVDQCWSCAGFTEKPKKSDLLEMWPDESGTMAEICERKLGPCAVCEGHGQTTKWVFNPNSGDQQKILLYDVLRFRKRHRKGTLRSDESALKDMLGEARTPEQKSIIDMILQAQKLQGMAGHYRRITPGEDGRIRTVLSPSATDTGRLASKETFLEASTNLQNLPKKTAAADPLYEVRNCIVPDRGRVICEADFSSAERRLLAYLANESHAIEQIESGVNSYKWFAGKMFGMKPEKIDKKSPLYHIGKMSVLALDRGVGWRKLKEQINKDADITGASVTAAQAKKAEALFHKEFPGYRRFHQEVLTKIMRSGYLINVAGRRRDFFGRRADESGRGAVAREGVSFLAQAIGDIIDQRLVEIYERYDPEDLRVLLQVHDAIIFDAPEASYERACRLVKEVMEKPIRLPSGREIIIPAELQASSESWGGMRDVL